MFEKIMLQKKSYYFNQVFYCGHSFWCLFTPSLWPLKNHSASGRNGLECNGFPLFEVLTCCLSLFVSVLLLWPVDNFSIFCLLITCPISPKKRRSSHHSCFRQMFSRDFFQQINQKKKRCQVDTLHHNDFLQVPWVFMVSHQHVSLPGSQSLLAKISTDKW